MVYSRPFASKAVDYCDNGERKIKKREEGASLSTRNVDEDLVRSFCLFTVMAPLLTPFHVLGVSSYDF